MTRDEFLDAFFGPGNLLSREQAEANEALTEFLSDLGVGLVAPVVLPRRRTASDVDWFVLCGDDTMLRRAQAEVQAFVGPSYARWDGARARLDTSDPVERAVALFAGGRALRFRTASDDEFRELWSALSLMRNAWQQRPTHDIERVRTGATLVRDFELAIAAGDAVVAGQRIVELRRRGLIGTENLRFLEIRHQASQGLWRELAEAADLRDLARIRRPWLVTEDLLTALYRSRVAVHEQREDVAAAISEARAIVDEVPEFFGTRGPLRTADVVKLFALRHALPGQEDTERLSELGELSGLASADRRWIAAIEDVVARSTRPARTSREAFAEGDLDAAFALARADGPSAERAEILIECAFEAGTIDAARAALSALDELDQSERDRLLDRRLVAMAVFELRGLADPPAAAATTPQTWTTWLESLLDEAAWPTADVVAQVGELEFTATDVLDVAAAERLAELMLAAADSPRRETFNEALPRIVGWLERQEAEPGSARPVHGAILTVIALEDTWRETSLEVAYNSIDALLRAGVDGDSYEEMLDQLGLLWTRMASRAHAAWLADLLELLEMYPGPRDQRVGFAAGAVALLLPFADRLDASVTESLARSCRAIGTEDLASALEARAPAPDEADDSRDALRGRLVGIYTLTPQVGVRAKDAIVRRFPGVRVEIDSSYVSTSSLEHLAATADYLIVSIRSAKHAATDAIERHRPREFPTLIPRGRGSSRMLEALVAAVE